KFPNGPKVGLIVVRRYRQIAPCRYYGSAYKGNLTIAAHDYQTHFGPIRELTADAKVYFTDVKGRCFAYTVMAVEVLKATAVADMLSEGWDLTLFTCTPSGQDRIAIRCIKQQGAFQ